MIVDEFSTADFKRAVRPTTFIESPRLSRRLGLDLLIASETFQITGSFKFRAAYNLASNVPNDEIITVSSGNFGQALAMACSMLGKRCTVAMPDISAQVKIDAVRGYGAEVDLVDVRVKSRNERLAELAREKPEAYVASPYDDRLVIEGNASLGREICAYSRELDYIVVPVGGGGLSSGIITGVKQSGRNIKVIGAEPLLANDAARSLRAGHIVKNEGEAPTIADGARTLSLGQLNWEILKESIGGIVEVPEEKLKEAVRMFFSLANLKSEPTGALSLGAILTKPDDFKGRRVCCVVSGGNVDTEIYRSILAD